MQNLYNIRMAPQTMVVPYNKLYLAELALKAQADPQKWMG
jgi:hypothetical protein